MDLYRRARLACAEGMSQREAARHFNISRDSVSKMMAFSVPPGYRRTAPVKRPKLDAYTGIIDGWLDGDREDHRKQRHTAKRVFERLRDEHGFTGGYTIMNELELIDRERRMIERRIKAAKFPATKSLDSFDFKAIPKLNKMQVLELARCEWTETFGTERLTGALLDRLTHHLNIIEMNGDSYRLGQSRARKAEAST